MSSPVIIGGGHNGLVAAYYLAKAGLRPVVLERREEVGGGAVTSELHPGFRCPTLTHHTCVHADVVRDLDLARHGVEFLTSPVEVFAPGRDGASLVLARDPANPGDTLRGLSAKDADAYPAYRASIQRLSSVLAPILTNPAPDIDRPGARDLWGLLGTGRRFRALGKRDAYRLLRSAPMPVADLTREWFESDLLCATLSGPALSGTMLGPRSAGSGLMLLVHETHRQLAGAGTQIRGGPGALTAAMAAAARAAGADIRTGAAVDRIIVRDGRASGVVVNGQELPASTVVSAVDPKTTFLGLIDPVDLTPDFRLKMQNFRARGTVAKVNLALSGLPAFGASPEVLSGRIHVGPELDYLERAFDHAKYGELSAEPWLDVTIPSILDPELAPPGAHVMSVYAHYAPFELRGAAWHAMRPALLAAVVDTLERFAPGIRQLVLEAQVITPAELASEYGFHGGHGFHGELALDQLVATRPLLGYARYGTPVDGLFLCGGGTHPGGFLTGASGRLAAAEVLRTPRH